MKKTVQISVDVNKEILVRFRETIYYKVGLKKGDFKTAVELAMLDYIQKHSKSESAKAHAKKMKEKTAQNTKK